jgi:hypothetical protein
MLEANEKIIGQLQRENHTQVDGKTIRHYAGHEGGDEWSSPMPALADLGRLQQSESFFDRR